MSSRFVVAAAVAACAFGFALTSAAVGRNSNPGVVPPNSSAHGASYGEWSGRWWHWAYSFPYGSSSNPVQDTTGAAAANGQSGSVWFLAGSFGTTETRTVTIPSGKSLFFPVINTAWVTVTALGDPPFSVPGAEQAARDAIAPFIDGADTVSLTVDGDTVNVTSAYRVKSPVFSVTFPDDSYGLDAGTYPECVSDGYWVMLSPLSRGQHEIHIVGGNSDAGFTTDVTYHITVN